MQSLLIGTSGYDYPEWRGKFYPENLKRKDFLEYYSSVFNALELNSTFYNPPTSERMKNFLERSGGRIFLSVKASRLLTHEITRSWKNIADEIKAALLPVLSKNLLSAVLFQFPQSFHYTVQNRFYLSSLLAEFQDFLPQVEFRNREWLRESVFEGIIKRNSSLVLCDMPEMKNLPGKMLESEAENQNQKFENDAKTQFPFLGKNAYLRLHGRNSNAWYSHSPENNGSSRYDYEYQEGELKEFVPVVKNILGSGKNVQIFFNNHPNGSGARNAKKLREMLENF